MKGRLTLFVLIALSLFLLNSCELLNPLFESKSKTLPDNFQISIERTHGTIQGQAKAVEILLHNNTLENYQLGSFEIMVAYDPNVLTFQSVEEGSFLTNCGWEYFTVRHQIIETDSTDIYAVRIFSYADLYPPIQTPLCFTPTDSSSNQLVVLNFLVTNDRTYECTFTPIQFFWEDCGDNMITDLYSSHMFMSRNIYNKLDTRRIDDTQNLAKETPFPNFSGYNSSCDPLVEERGIDMSRNIDFINGGIDIGGPCMIQNARGDINLNEIAYEIADAILYSRYFVYGNSVFTKDIEKQIEQSDIDADGITLTLADLVYLIRVMVGDVNPYPSEVVNEATYAFGSIHYHGNDIYINSFLRIAAVRLLVKGNIIPTLLADNMTMTYAFDGSNTNILIYSIENNNFTGNMINIGNSEVLSYEMADHLGNIVKPIIIPDSFKLQQNYPNPFKDSTTIGFQVTSSARFTEVTIEIKNINNQVMFTHTKMYEAGIHSIKVNATSWSSGRYFYTMRANNFVETKSMTLLN